MSASRGPAYKGGVFIQGVGQTSLRIRKAGGTHPTGKLSCSTCFCVDGELCSFRCKRCVVLVVPVREDRGIWWWWSQPTKLDADVMRCTPEVVGVQWRIQDFP